MYVQQQQQQHHQGHYHHQHTASQGHRHQQQQQYEYTAPVSRHLPSTRAYSYHPYAAPTPSPRVSRYVAPWDVQGQVPTLNDYAASSPLLDYSPYGSMHTATDAFSFPLYTPTTVNPYQTIQHQQQQQLPTCIAPEDLYTPISPSFPEDADDRALSPLSTDNSSNSSNSNRSSPTRLGLQIPPSTVSPSSLSLTASSGSSLAPSSGLPSPVDSISSNDSSEQAFIPTPSLRKSSTKTAGAKRSTRSAAPEPAWVEAVLAEDAKRIQDSIDAGVTTTARPSNRPIAFACVFCRHRKIQCIRPKVEAGPGEKPLPCNQCEKRSRCCEYPPAALNPRMGRRAKNED
ncbi:hypothetical protein M408DRAFT_325368 [Serendipita vermifera MAFF 305830]|uniref:Zn(2)-C6 fungal-type domain-containing protein n=1 Tax=Serendipita vermifera MAFF 305830 TaxID=933852 RepID=A0A0C3BAD0_SERVB|nr:hypothetical protein M408DRAFT_325368 [Serendipita vermifera MAFF 305830]